MTSLVERLADLHRHLTHLHTLAPRVTARESLERDPVERSCRIVADVEHNAP